MRLYSRGGMAAMAEALKGIPCCSAVIDGELILSIRPVRFSARNIGVAPDIANDYMRVCAGR